MRLVILGAPGSGKGTQSAKITAKYAVPGLSTGDMLRQEVALDAELGQEIGAIMAQGKLVSDEIVLQMIASAITSPSCVNGFILDGFPRNKPQAEGLTKLLRQLHLELDAVILLMVEESRLLGRIKTRAASSIGAPRADDSAEALATRIAIYNQQTAPLIDYYRKLSLLLPVDGMGDVSQVEMAIDQGIAGIAA